MPASRTKDVLPLTPTLRAWGDPPPSRVPLSTRVVATQEQLCILNAFHAHVGPRPSKVEVEDVSRQTGLEARWIRNWLSRKNNPRNRSKNSATRKGTPSEVCSTSGPALIATDSTSALHDSSVSQSGSFNGDIPDAASRFSLFPPVLDYSASEYALIAPSSVSQSPRFPEELSAPSEPSAVYSSYLLCRDDTPGQSEHANVSSSELPFASMEVSVSTENVLALIHALEAAAAAETPEITSDTTPENNTPAAGPPIESPAPLAPVPALRTRPIQCTTVNTLPLYSTPPISFRMRYSDVIAMYQKALQEYEANKTLTGSTGDDDRVASPKSDGSADSSIDDLLTPTDSPALNPCDPQTVVQVEIDVASQGCLVALPDLCKFTAAFLPNTPLTPLA